MNLHGLLYNSIALSSTFMEYLRIDDGRISKPNSPIELDNDVPHIIEIRNGSSPINTLEVLMKEGQSNQLEISSLLVELSIIKPHATSILEDMSNLFFLFFF